MLCGFVKKNDAKKKKKWKKNVFAQKSVFE